MLDRPPFLGQSSVSRPTPSIYPGVQEEVHYWGQAQGPFLCNYTSATFTLCIHFVYGIARTICGQGGGDVTPSPGLDRVKGIKFELVFGI